MTAQAQSKDIGRATCSWAYANRALCEEPQMVLLSRSGRSGVGRLLTPQVHVCAMCRFVKKIIIAKAASTRERLEITDEAFDLVHTLGTNHNGIVKVLRRNSTRAVHTFTMTQLGPDLRKVPPSTEEVRCENLCLGASCTENAILRVMQTRLMLQREAENLLCTRLQVSMVYMHSCN